MHDKIILATNNRGKVREFRELLAGLPNKLITLAEAGIDIEVSESGSTFEENAVIKARAVAQASNSTTLADDSGLEVDALGGEPGVKSARYAGEGASDADRVRFLLAKLEGVAADRRTARFRCVIAIATPDGRVGTCSGACEGMIINEPRGNNGFGYDPVFYFPELKKTMSELPIEIKNRISHRGRAAAQVPALLKRMGL